MKNSNTLSLPMISKRKVFTGLVVLWATMSFSSCKSRKEKVDENLAIIPHPVSVNLHSGIYHLKSPITISLADSLQHLGNLFSDYVREIGYKIKPARNKHADVSFSINSSLTIQDEGYVLNINRSGVTLKSRTEQGLFYGMQTLLHLIAVQGKNLPQLEITDYPRFPYRGLHLDVGRHMFPPAFIKRYIDLMSRLKFNRFHWHLTEDQGWRIEIKKYPKLQEIAAWRDETIVGHAGKSNAYDGQRYGGYYTQEEIRDIVRYAAERYITIIPEIEMPGHSRAALAAYPNLGCTGGPYTVATTWGVFEDVYCAGKEDTFTFLQDVLDEVMELFPGTYIHIGGDEVPKKRWKACKACQQRMKSEKLKDEHELQSYFIQCIEKYLNSKGRQIIGWDEILEGGLAPNATVMSWRGEEGGIAAAKQQHTVIMTPGNWCYFDHYQASPETEPLAIGGFTPVEEVYSYEPMPASLTEAEQKMILGAQGNVWTEYMKTPEHVEYMVYPRALALAEVVWSPKEKRNYDDFLDRLKQMQPWLDALKINYARHVFSKMP